MKKLLTEKRKKSIIVYLILWLLLAIVFVVPLATVKVDSTLAGKVDPDTFKSIVGNYLLDISTRFKAFESNYIDTTKTFLGYFTFLYLGIMLILFLKSKTSSDYHDIEHGSSDWCEGGEQYKVLSKTSGLILAEKNYLPIDKPGNINVLIVGRIW